MTADTDTQGNLQDLLATIGGVLGFCMTVLSFVLNLQAWAQDPEAFRAVSVAGFFLYLSGTMWFAFKAQNVSPKLRWASLGALYVATGLYALWVGSWLIAPAPQPVLVDTLDAISMWTPYLDDMGSSLEYGPARGRRTGAMELAYTVEKNGYVGVAREISPAILAGTQAIGLSYRGGAGPAGRAPNTLELKLIYRPNEAGRSAIFSVLWNHATDVETWTVLQAPYGLFVCWTGTGCQPGEALDLDEVWKVDIAISNKPGDTPGSGVLLVDDIQGFR